MGNKSKKELNKLLITLRTQKDASTEKIKKNNEDLKEKIDHLEKIQVKSDMHVLLNIIPGILPDGTCLYTLSASYSSKNILPSRTYVKLKSNLSYLNSPVKILKT